MREQIIGIGGANVDLCGKAVGSVIAGDSNIGRIHISAGGVCRNICENVVRMGVPAALISVVGDDVNGDYLLRHCKSTGLDISAVRRIVGKRTGAYFSIHSGDGEMVAAINDMEIVDCITPTFLEPYIDRIRNAKAVLVDANLPSDTIRWIGETFADRPLFADPVSCAKAENLRPILHRLFLLKPNQMEAKALTGCSDPKASAAALHEAGVRHVCVSCGAEGVVYCGEQGNMLTRPKPLLSFPNATGAGDSLMGGLLAAYAQGLTLDEALRFAVTASVLTLQSPDTIRPDLSRESIIKSQKECIFHESISFDPS